MKNDDNLRKEHEAIRNGVGFYNFTHELLEVTGKDAGEFLDKVFVNNISGSDISKAVYTTMLNEDGQIIDDVIVFHIDEDKYWISTLDIESMIDWFDKHIGDEEVEYEDITDTVSMYAVQGPDSERVLNSLLKNPIDDIDYLTIHDNKLKDLDVKVARSGFTGELGYELYTVPECNTLIEDILDDQGDALGITHIQSDVVVGSIPAEKGYALMTDLEGLNPIEADFGWSVDWDSDFIGKEAILEDKENGPKRSLLGFELNEDEAEIEPGAKVLKDGEEVGRVTKFTYGYTIEKYIGYAVIDNELANIGDKVEIDGYDATLTERVFYDKENKKVRDKE